MSKLTKNRTPTNNKGLPHGLWKRYNYNGNLRYKCFFQNGKKVGYEEWYSISGRISRKKYNL